MGWHIDDYTLLKNISENQQQLKNNLLKISQNENLYTPTSAPKYSVIYYHSNYDHDFKGGTLEFVDGTIIKPEKGLVIYFDSREVHRLNVIEEGIRKITLLKFY